MKSNTAVQKVQRQTSQFVLDELARLNERVARLQSLIEVTAIISSVLDLEELLNLVMEKAQSVMRAEASSVLLLNESTGKLECEVALGAVSDQIKEKVSLDLGQGIGGWVAQTGEPLIVADVSMDPRFYAKSDEITGFKTRSILAAPLKVKEKVIGIAEVLNPVDGRAFTNEDLDLFITFSRQVALAIENAKIHRYLLEKQKLEQQLEAAYSIQQSFMPQTFPQSSEGAFSVWATNLPAKSIGGDFYDFIEFTPQPKLGIMIGDVSGKGIPAALYMARLVSDLRFYSLSEKTPAACLSAVNNTLATRSRRGMFVTLVYLLLDLESGKLQITNGGHLSPIWYHHTTGQIEMLEHLEGIPLGISRMATFQATEIQLAPGDSLVLFTDGVIEAKNKRGMQFSRTGLIEALHTRWESPKALVTHLIKRVLHFSQGMAQHDDITIVAFTWRPRQP